MDSVQGQRRVVHGRRPVKQRKKGGKLILVAALVLILVGAGIVAYPFVLGMISNASMNQAIQDFTGQFDTPAESTYMDIDASAMAVDTNNPMAPEELPVDNNWYISEAGSAENAEYLLEIPKLDKRIPVFAAKDLAQMYPNMRKGASLYPDTAQVGKIGNTAMAAHRTGPSDFFLELDKLSAGDSLIMHTKGYGSYKYEVEAVDIAMPDAWEYVSVTQYPALTLTTCQAHGGVSNARRLIVRAKLVQYAPPAAQQALATP